MSDPSTSFVLPPAVVSRADLTRLVRELELVDNDLEQQKARRQGASGNYRLPNMSQALSDFLSTNTLDVADDHVRMDLKAQLRKLKDHAPVMHMTFSTEVDPESLQFITAWVRSEEHTSELQSP